MNNGKRFEYNFKKSIPQEIFCLRLKDGTAGWGEGENTRFQHYNPCDFLLHHKGFLFLLELKSHKGKSIPFNCIRETQLRELNKVSENFRTELAFICFHFSDLEETYLVNIADVYIYIQQNLKSNERKSFPIAWISEVGYYVPAKKKKVNYTYDVLNAINNIVNEIPI